MFTELRILVQTFISSMRALAWSMLFLFVSMVIGALFLSFILHDFIMLESHDHKTRVWVYNHYGNAMLAVYTLFEVTLAGCWPTYFRPLVQKVSGWYVLFVVAYVCFVVFALTRIITALLLRQTLESASSDTDMQIMLHRRERDRGLKKLKNLFQSLDSTGEGFVTQEHVNVLVTSAEGKTVLKMLELEVIDAESLFNLLDTDQSGSIEWAEFLTGVTRLRGQARSIDVVAILRASDQMHSQLHQMRAEFVEFMRQYSNDSSSSKAGAGECNTDASVPKRIWNM